MTARRVLLGEGGHDAGAHRFLVGGLAQLEASNDLVLVQNPEALRHWHKLRAESGTPHAGAGAEVIVPPAAFAALAIPAEGAEASRFLGPGGTDTDPSPAEPEVTARFTASRDSDDVEVEIRMRAACTDPLHPALAHGCLEDIEAPRHPDDRKRTRQN